MTPSRQRSSPTATETLQQVTADRPGERLDVAIARLCDISRAQAQRLIDDRLVSDERRIRTKAGDKLEGGERLSVRLPAAVPAAPLPEDIHLSILFEDEHLLVVDKPAGMPVHPGPGHSSRTLVNALLAHCPDLPGIGGVQRPGIVHRLDKDTSGLMVVAKDERAHAGLSAQLKDREMSKTYLALVEGKLLPPEALIDAPIGRDPNNRRRMMVRSSSGSGQTREAQTSYKLRTQYESCALVEVTLHTGRTHQIRVHFASLGHPVVGDVVYGHRSRLVGRQFLHAWRLRFRHPVDGRELSFEAPLPQDLQEVLQALEA
ncbi:MAG TPA: RluA family pseudouridine synthase [Dehalococcoidia bacterium]|nr:RluA family pseudouridine synthase [Dehalococcoidia bacterium]